MTAHYSDSYKREVLEYARDNGAITAQKRYGLPHATITRWNRTLKIYTEREIPDYKRCITQEQIQILRRAKEIYDEMPDDTKSVHQAFLVVAEELGITKDQMRNWNDKYKIVPLRPRAKQKISQEIINAVQTALNQKRGRITAASRQSGISVHTLNKLKKDKKISFSIAQRNISTHPPVVKNKSKDIAAIIQMLLQSKKSK